MVRRKTFVQRKTQIACLASFLMLAALAACAPPPAVFVSPIATPPAARATPGASPQEELMPAFTPPPQPTIPGATPAAQPGDRALAVADLATQLNISADAITVVSVERVEWNDASLGCAKPGRMYAQVISPGYRIVLEANGQNYEYHTGGGRIIRCQP